LKTEYRYRKIYLNPVFSFTQYYGHCQFTPEFINYFISTPYTPLFFHTFRISYQHR
jgi:hypothetical protein